MTVEQTAGFPVSTLISFLTDKGLWARPSHLPPSLISPSIKNKRATGLGQRFSSALARPVSLSEMQTHDLLHQALWDQTQPAPCEDSDAPRVWEPLNRWFLWSFQFYHSQNLKLPWFSLFKLPPIWPLWFWSGMNLSHLALSSGCVWSFLLCDTEGPKTQFTPLHFFFPFTTSAVGILSLY